jgi:hypothetical protein
LARALHCAACNGAQRHNIGDHMLVIETLIAAYLFSIVAAIYQEKGR